MFGVQTAVAVKPRYNIAPTQEVAAIRESDADGRELALLRWGLVPFWAKDPSIGNRMINARAETVAEKPAFRAAYRKRRCLVLADGFYEWKKETAGKTPYLISLASGQPFALAGLWEHWEAKGSDDVIDSATIVTTDANDFMVALHDRMPVILEPESAERWLSGADDALEFAVSHVPELRAWPVDRRVNNARNEGEDLIAPAGATRGS